MLSIYAKAQALKARLLKDENGATAIEYGLIAAGIAVAIVTIVFTLGDELEKLFQDIQSNVQKRPS